MKRLVKDLRLGDTVQSHDGQWHTVTAVAPFWNQRRLSVVELDNVSQRLYHHRTELAVRERLLIG
jgi:quercetin dioxygenase-like cupin family protein